MVFAFSAVHVALKIRQRNIHRHYSLLFFLEEPLKLNIIKGLML